MIFQNADGGLRLTIDEHSRAVVVHLLGELRAEVESAKEAPFSELAPHMKRLFPAAYHADEKRDEEYRRLTHGDLADAHLGAVDDAIRLLDPGAVFSRADLDRFVRAINAMRLVLGTMLDVSEDEDSEEDQASSGQAEADDPTVMQRQVYDYLGWLLHTSLDELRA